MGLLQTCKLNCGVGEEGEGKGVVIYPTLLAGNVSYEVLSLESICSKSPLLRNS